MQVAFHLGAHRTDNSALLRSLVRSRSRLALHSVMLPEQTDFLPGLLDAVDRGADRPNGTRRRLRAAMGGEPRRVVFSSEEFLGAPLGPDGEFQLYPDAANRMKVLAALFPDEGLEFHLAIRSPATFLPPLMKENSGGAWRPMLSSEIGQLRWSELLERMRAAIPQAAITVWCDEDIPMIWTEALDAVAGHSQAVSPDALLDRLASLLTDEGQRRLAAMLSSDPPLDSEARREAVADQLARYGRRDAMELSLDMPGWSNSTIDQLSDAYEEDVDRIEEMRGVTFIAP